ncbi:MAG: glucose-6-phosphate dehydrogenase [Bacteroidetes bacterium]|nr:glucose-6-phosphate dehydrogenase [Bacteroidota bacterium]
MEKNVSKLPASIIFIFGGSGDLTHRKLGPSLYHLFLDGWMPEKFAIIGMGRTAFDDTQYQNFIKEGIKEFSERADDKDGSVWEDFAKNISFMTMDVKDDEAYKSLEKKAASLQEAWNEKAKIVFYLAVAPQLVPTIATELGKFKMCGDTDCTRIVVEKPFGFDLESAHELNTLLLSLFKEDQIYRIDHFLGKETVQNILALRFANALFEPLWNQNYIDHIQITAAEEIGVEDRGDYYEKSGALRDMVQNHILQLLCMVAMEPPVNFDANEIRNKKVDVLNAIRKISREEVHSFAVRGQYKSGWMKGEKVNGYREEKNVNPQSNIETFAAMKFYVDNWRWQNVPFYVRTGKYLHEKITLITVQFKQPPHSAFPSEATETWRPNRLTITIQPDEDIRLRFQTKRPGQDMVLNPVEMVFKYSDAYQAIQPDAYETLLLDILEGNTTQFMRADQVEVAWKVVMPVLEAWQSRLPTDFPNYAPDSWGPEDAEALIARDGNNWYSLPAQNGLQSKSTPADNPR